MCSLLPLAACRLQRRSLCVALSGVACAPLCVLFLAMFLCVSNRSGGVSHLFSQQFYVL
jgi:hypothetical protein